MSGPKVVRIVTREEILEICRGHLARVDAALEEWTRIGRRNDCVDAEAIAAATRRRDALAALVAADRFMDLQKQAPIEEAFLREDLTHRLAEVARRQAEARSRERRERDAGASLLRALEQRGPVEPALAQGLRSGDAGALAEGFRALSAGAGAPAASAGLAASLREDERPRDLASWMAGRPPEPADPLLDRLDGRLAELAVALVGERLDGMRARLEEAWSAPPARRSLLLDGLDVETGRALETERRRAALLMDLRLVAAEIGAAGLEVDAYLSGADTLEPASLETRIEAARSALDAHRAQSAAAARREAVLEGLAKLGYEVTEGMSTSLAADGRVVLRSAGRPEYGVEVASAGATGRMQMRPVAFGLGTQGPDPSRDRDAETIWCGDVSTLQERLAEVGAGLEIERALPVGAVPLKRVAAAGVGTATATIEVPAARTRSLPTR